jgi:AraC-like DNA-binding protein
MSNAAADKKAFARARLNAADDLLCNGNLSPAARLVGLAIFRHVNRITGLAFPSEQTIADRLGLSERHVRRAIGELRGAGCIKVMRRGRSNVYLPAFAATPDKLSAFAEQKADKSSGMKQDNMSGVGAAIPDIYHRDTGHFCQNTGHGCPPNSFNNPIRTLGGSLATALPTGALREPQASQKTENEIAAALGWQCFMDLPAAVAEDLRKRWPNVEPGELFELKRKYEPSAAVEGQRVEGEP